MTMLLAPPSGERASTVRERTAAVEDRATLSASDRSHDLWACGLGSSDPVAREKCRDINPELIIELL